MKRINGEWLTKEEAYHKHHRLIRYTANRYIEVGKRYGCDADDLFQIACIGFLNAYDNYEDNGGKFSSYAVPTMRGKIRNTFRDKGHLVNVSRTAFMLGKQIYDNGLQDENDTHIMNYFGVSREHAIEALSLIRGMCKSLNKLVGEDEEELGDLLGRESDFTSVFVNEFLDSLTNRDKTIFLMAVKGAPQREISEAVGVGQVQVSRVFRKLKERYKQYQEGVEVNG